MSKSRKIYTKILKIFIIYVTFLFETDGFSLQLNQACVFRFSGGDTGIKYQ